MNEGIIHVVFGVLYHPRELGGRAVGVSIQFARIHDTCATTYSPLLGGIWCGKSLPSQPLHARSDLHAIFASARAKFLDLESPLALAPAPRTKK